MLNRRAYYCPKCGNPSVLFSTQKSDDGKIVRIRACGICRYSYKTIEMIEEEADGK